ncbi:ATP-dependent protease ClpP protease subunit [Fusobacterium naviforme]|nr:Clp protease ClpP [Fusobacterium naviforme]PSL09120.1 ATP-dependent protease ClpP protease subunit [Fusobacterium naviforme]STO27696.1 ATP-dependent Clp protease proteolytic subunit [Fusobacterium naviforme]
MPFPKFFERRGNQPVNIRRDFYNMASENFDTVEITMYGDIVQEQPRDWWTDEPIPGQWIALDTFMDDLERISGYKNIRIRMNTYGGDCVAAFVIHNRLRELSREGANLTCIIDGVSMSAGTVIMSACDRVLVNPNSLIMIHKCWSYLFGGYNADELEELARQHAKYDQAIITTYTRKTGLSATVLSHMMSDTTYLTGKEAVEKGFADELIEDAEPLDIAASADGRILFCRDRQMHLAPGMFAPDSIPTREEAPEEPDAHEETEVTPGDSQPVDNTPNTPGESGSEEGGHNMTLDELRAQDPELVAQIQTEAANAATEAERTRLSDIDAIANQFTDEMVADAKYGENRCSAMELAYRAAQQAAAQGRRFLASAEADADESNADEIEAAPAPAEETGAETDEEKQAKADAFFANAMKEGK